MLDDVTPDDAIKFKNQLVHDGLIQDQDFCWAYHHARYEFGTVAPRYAVFDFVDGATATFYQLKWIKT